MDKDTIRSRMHKSLDALKRDLAKIRTGVATPAMLDGVMVDYYGTPTAVPHLANISVPEPRTLLIQPFEKGMLGAVEKAIQQSDLGLTPINDGGKIRLSLPVLTTQRRQELAKQARKIAEEARVGIRNIRRDENDRVKKEAKQSSESEDAMKHELVEVQSLTDEFIGKVDELVSQKEADIMQV